ncbi:hypothetical protein ScPMuIL_001228 [Solemya velum]
MHAQKNAQLKSAQQREMYNKSRRLVSLMEIPQKIHGLLTEGKKECLNLISEKEKTPFPARSILKSYEDIPGPKGLPFIGTLLDYFKKDGLRFNKLFKAFQHRYWEYGPVYKESIMGITNVIITDPQEYKKVVHAEGRYPVRMTMEPLAHYCKMKGSSLGLVNSQGEEWYKYRSITSKKLLKIDEVSRYCGQMSQVAGEFADQLALKRTLEGNVEFLQKELFKWAMESAGTILFEQRLGCLQEKITDEAKYFIDSLQGFFDTMQSLTYSLPLYKIYPTQLWKQFESNTDNVRRLGRFYVEKKMSELQTGVDDKNTSLLAHLLSHDALSTEEAVSTTIDLLMGATETATNGALWALYCLATNPLKQKICFEEISRVLPESAEVSPEHLRELIYIKAVFKESLRLYPITFTTSRYIQSSVHISGYELPVGTHVQANIYGMFHDPVLFPSPAEFKPERWLKQTSDLTSTQNSLSSLVWGHGARMCIGRRLAEQEIYILLAKVIQNFKLEYSQEPVEPVLKIVMTPDRPMKIRFIPRIINHICSEEEHVLNHE